MLKALALVASIAVTPVAASTFSQGDTWTGQFSGEQVLTFSAPYATPCGDGDWSMCSYQGGGMIYAVKDPSQCGGWCGTVLDNFNLSAYQPLLTVTLDFSQWADRWIVVHFTGNGPVLFKQSPKQLATEAIPAAVPLPASLPLLLGGVLGLAALRARRKA